MDDSDDGAIVNRLTVPLVLAAFMVFGVLGWVWGMPKPATTAGAAAAPYPIVMTGPARPTPVSGGTVAMASGSTSLEEVTASTVADAWLLDVSTSTRIPVRVLQAYAAASIAQDSATPSCGLGWNTLAAIGSVESGHGTYGGASIDADGALVGDILGPPLDGRVFAAIRDTDDGRLDGDTQWDRAVGPMQFIPSTWASYGTDGNGDQITDPRQIDDATRSAAAYLCAAGGNLATTEGWSAAVRAYNADDTYVESVRELANEYAAAVQPSG